MSARSGRNRARAVAVSVSELVTASQVTGITDSLTKAERVNRESSRQRSERNAARTSAEKSSGSSQAAKCPPLSTALK